AAADGDHPGTPGGLDPDAGRSGLTGRGPHWRAHFLGPPGRFPGGRALRIARLFARAQALPVPAASHCPVPCAVPAAAWSYFLPSAGLRLEAIVNFREGEVAGNPTDIRLGKVRYSSSRCFQAQDDDVPVFV